MTECLVKPVSSTEPCFRQLCNITQLKANLGSDVVDSEYKVSIVSFYATQQLNQEDYNKPEGSYNHTRLNYLILLSCLCTGKTVTRLRPS